MSNIYMGYSYGEQNMLKPFMPYEVTISENDKIISIEQDGSLMAELSLALEGNTLIMKGKNDLVLAEVELPSTDLGELEKISSFTYDKEKSAIVLTVINGLNEEESFEIDVQEMVDIYQAGQGISISDDHTISVRLQEDTTRSISSNLLNFDEEGNLSFDSDAIVLKEDYENDKKELEDKLGDLDNINGTVQETLDKLDAKDGELSIKDTELEDKIDKNGAEISSIKSILGTLTGQEEFGDVVEDLAELKLEVGKCVKHDTNPNDVSRKVIYLDNNENICGYGTDGTAYNLVMVSKWDVADFGSQSLSMGLNSKDGKITINDNDTSKNGGIVATEAFVETVVTTSADNLSQSINQEVLRATEVEKELSDKIDDLVGGDGELSASINGLNTRLETIEENIPTLASKEELENGLENVVRYSEFDGYDVNINPIKRKTIQLANYDSISGVDTKGIGHNLVMLSQWDVADFGAANVAMNLNTTDDNVVKINDEEIIATRNWVEDKFTDFSSTNDDVISGINDTLKELDATDKGLEDKIDKVESSLTETINETKKEVNESIKTLSDSITLDKIDDLTYNLVVDGNQQGQIIIPKDKSIESIAYDKDNYLLTFVWANNDDIDGLAKSVTVDLSGLSDTYNAGDGIIKTVVDGIPTFTVNLNQSKWLKVENGSLDWNGQIIKSNPWELKVINNLSEESILDFTDDVAAFNQERNSILETSINQLKEELLGNDEANLDTINGLKNQVETNKADIEATTELIEGLETRISAEESQHRNDIATVTANINALQKNIETHQTDINQLYDETSGLTVQLDALKKQTTSDAEYALENIETLLSVTSSHTTSITELGNNVIQLQKDVEQNSNDILANLDLIEKLESTTNSHQTSISKNQSDITTLKDTTNQLVNNLSTLQTNFDTHVAHDFNGLTTTVSGIASELTETKGQVVTNQNSINELNRRVSVLETKIADVNKSIEELSSSLELKLNELEARLTSTLTTALSDINSKFGNYMTSADIEAKLLEKDNLISTSISANNEEIAKWVGQQGFVKATDNEIFKNEINSEIDSFGTRLSNVENTAATKDDVQNSVNELRTEIENSDYVSATDVEKIIDDKISHLN